MQWTSQPADHSVCPYEPLTRYIKLRVELLHRECRERFPCHWLQRKPLVNDPRMHHGTCVTHVPLCMSGLLTRGGRENVPSIRGAWAARNFTYPARDPWLSGYCTGPVSSQLDEYRVRNPMRLLMPDIILVRTTQLTECESQWASIFCVTNEIFTYMLM